jgi:hypothetical protein
MSLTHGLLLIIEYKVDVIVNINMTRPIEGGFLHLLLKSETGLTAISRHKIPPPIEE